MTATTALHSNAFNFMSFLQSGVDPRTGQYTVSLNLPQVEANALLGPSLPLALFFNPLNQQDTGYGKGWNLQLSQFTPDTQVAALHTGESFLVTSRNGAQMLMEEKKLDSFHLDEVADGGSTHYLVEHRSGLLEKLQIRAASRPVALPVEVWTRQTLPLKFTYASFESDGQTYDRLASIEGSDVEGVYAPLLEIKRDESKRQVEITLNPQGAAATQVRFVMQLDTQGRVIELQLPTVDGNQAKWRFMYTVSHTYNCLAEVRTPTGAWELITYDPVGHKRSNNLPGTLPRVSKHEVRPGNADEAPKAGASCNQIVSYAYTVNTEEDGYQADNNFLGANLALGEPTPGLDILYKHPNPYRYGSVETLLSADGKTSLRSIERHFNKFHLLTREITSQGPADDLHIQTVETSYAYTEGKPFKDQPAYCQLPLTTTTTWRKAKTDTARTEVLKRTYHDDGNLHTVEHPSGVVETSLWYPAAGEIDKCPADPSGFVRHLKSKTVTPAKPGQTLDAPILSQGYRYRTLPAYEGNASTTAWHVVEVETLDQINEGGAVIQPLQSTQYKYFERIEQPLTYGRLEEHTLTMNDLPTKTSYTYATRAPTFATHDNNETVLVTTQTVTGHDNSPTNIIKKTTTSERSLLTGELLLSEDDNGVRINYRYDVLRRVIQEVVAPESPYQADRSYTYWLCANDNDRASQKRTDVNCVLTHTLLDGLNRPVKEQRNDLDNATPRQEGEEELLRALYLATYDAFGRLQSETETDWRSAQTSDDLTLIRSYDYDDWGQQRAVTGPDGIKVIEEDDPVGESYPGQPADAPKQRIVKRWRESTDGESSGINKTWLNLFNQPARTERLQWSGEGDNYQETRISLQQNTYDGLGRTLSEAVGLLGERVNKYSYDVFGRQLEQTLADGAKVVRTFAKHSNADLPTSISVAGKELGQKEYDGLDREKSTTTGKRKQTYTYKGSERKPCEVVTPGGQIIRYQYEFRLNEEPKARQFIDVTAHDEEEVVQETTFTYHEKNARLRECSVMDQTFERTHYLNGAVKWEKRELAGVTYEVNYGHSQRGRITSYTGAQGLEQTYDYDENSGQLTGTGLGDQVSSELSYDSFGRLCSFTTGNPPQSLETKLTYDQFDRECTRTFVPGSGDGQCLEHCYNDVDALTSRTLRNTKTQEIIRLETYGYDDRQRLTSYECTGSELPVDPSGAAIKSQVFTYDELDNIDLCMTEYQEGGEQIIFYSFSDDDPAQLKGLDVVSHHGGLKALDLAGARLLVKALKLIKPLDLWLLWDLPALHEIELTYDANGNMTCDEQGHLLEYDRVNRLIKVSRPSAEGDIVLAEYHYDGKDILTGMSRDGVGTQNRLYQGGRVASLQQAGNSITFYGAEGLILGELQDENGL